MPTIIITTKHQPKYLTSYYLRFSFFTIVLLLLGCEKKQAPITVSKGDHIILIGNNLPARMMHYGYFETEMHMRFPDSTLFIRNMGDAGNTPGFRPHSGRNTPWAFPGAEKFYPEYNKAPSSEGHLEYPDEWLTRLKADIILAFFGFNESFGGEDKIDSFSLELQAFIDHSLNNKYNNKRKPELVLISPTAFEDLSTNKALPDGKIINENLKRYSDSIAAIAARNNIPFVDIFNTKDSWYKGSGPYTIDGLQLNEKAFAQLSAYLAEEIFGGELLADVHRKGIHKAVKEKNWLWHNDFKIPNGVHVFGRRYNPFGPDNYPYELRKIREMTAIRDTAIWKAAKGIKMDLAKADLNTFTLPEVITNYKSGDYGRGKDYLYGEDALNSMEVAAGYKIELFASEREFPELANPVQLSFDNKGRLWIAAMPSYPHYKPGDPKPNDKLIILEDKDKDGKADHRIVWADSLHLPIGFEFAPEGVYVSQGTHLKLLKDTDNDDRADTEEIILSGFDDHDTHHAISAFTTDPSGAIYMAEGIFLHTNVETPYGPVRATNGGFYRYNTTRHHLERTAQILTPNPWGIAFDKWGQNFYLDTSGPGLHWMMPSTIKSIYDVFTPNSRDLVPEDQKVRPTAGLEFVSSRHFPEEVQGDLLLANSIGFLGIKQHAVKEQGTGYILEHRQDLFQSKDFNFRPVDLEFAPDGSLYVVDWHNILVGHMQHNARDPYRDHAHGRIYRITYPSRPLVTPFPVAESNIEELLNGLKLPEFRTRYRIRRALRGKPAEEVLESLSHWIQNLDSKNDQYEHHLLEALWVSWGLNRIDKKLLKNLLNAEDYKVRAAAVRAVRYNMHQIDGGADLLAKAAKDDHGRVRLEAVVAASWLDKETAQQILNIASMEPIDDWMNDPYLAVQHRLSGVTIKSEAEAEIPDAIPPEMKEQYILGRSVYNKEGYCGTCHQPDGKGLPASGFPPLADSEWVTENTERLIKITLKGLQGPITVAGKEYPGQVPMTAFEILLSDEEIAAVLTYIRNSFGNSVAPIGEEQVKKIRAKIAQKRGYYSPEELNDPIQ